MEKHLKTRALMSLIIILYMYNNSFNHFMALSTILWLSFKYNNGEHLWVKSFKISVYFNLVNHFLDVYFKEKIRNEVKDLCVI